MQDLEKLIVRYREKDLDNIAGEKIFYDFKYRSEILEKIESYNSFFRKLEEKHHVKTNLRFQNTNAATCSLEMNIRTKIVGSYSNMEHAIKDILSWDVPNEVLPPNWATISYAVQHIGMGIFSIGAMPVMNVMNKLQNGKPIRSTKKIFGLFKQELNSKGYKLGIQNLYAPIYKK